MEIPVEVIKLVQFYYQVPITLMKFLSSNSDVVINSN